MSSEATSPDYGSVLSDPFAPNPPPSSASYASSASSSPSSAPAYPPGFTRSLVGPDYALVAPESRTWAAPANDPRAAGRPWEKARVAHLISPGRAGSGAAFSMFLAKLEGGGRMGPLPHRAAERFVFVLDGVVRVETTAASERRGEPPSGGNDLPSRQRQRKRTARCSPAAGNFTLHADGFAFFPPHCGSGSELLLPSVTAGPGGAGMVVFERIHVSRATGRASEPSSAAADGDETGGAENEVETEETLPFFVWGRAASELPLLDPGHPETFGLRKLLPHSGPDAFQFDFNVHLMDFAPGEFLNTKEVHHNQHGLLMLRGQGIYRLSDSVWAPVTAGDAIFMGPYVTQWFAGLGREGARYLIFKDTAPDPLLRGAGFP
mgnify:CR=1 FL=1